MIYTHPRERPHKSLTPIPNGVIECITFYNEENGYTVARFIPGGKAYRELITLFEEKIRERIARVWGEGLDHERREK